MDKVLFEKLFDHLLRGKVIINLFYVALLPIGILVSISLYSTKVIASIPLYYLPNASWDIFSNVATKIFIISIIFGIIYHPILRQLYILCIQKDESLEIRCQEKAHAVMSLLQDGVQFCLALTFIFYAYDALAYYNEYASLRTAAFPVQTGLAIITLYIFLLYILPRLYWGSYNRIHKISHTLSGTGFCDDDGQEILIGDAVSFQNKKFKIIIVHRLKEPDIVELSHLTTNLSITLESAAEIGGLKILHKR